MSDTVIKVENLFKEYRLGTIGHGTLRHDLASWWANLRGKDDPNSLITKTAPSAPAGHLPSLRGEGKKDVEELKQHFLALNDVSFEVKAGDVLGVIGRNGAGKSTLLKILSRVTAPSAGTIKAKGRMASLLEVGTGFHPELTGRENIYMNGALLGMRRYEIARKMDEIVAFAELEKFIDTPVKRYSSGMYVKLAFSIAAHLDAEILVMDEVLAVGDATFQKKCLGKMDDVAKNQGRTVLFVSHNMGAVSSLCSRAIVLDTGMLLADSKISEAIGLYLLNSRKKDLHDWYGVAGDENLRILHTWIKNFGNTENTQTDSDIEIGVEIEVLKPIYGLIAGIIVFSEYGYEIAYLLHDDLDNKEIETVSPGKYIKRFVIPKNTLAEGTYKIEFDIGIHMKERIIKDEGSLWFEIENVNGIGKKYPLSRRQGWTSLFRPEFVRRI